MSKKRTSLENLFSSQTQTPSLTSASSSEKPTLSTTENSTLKPNPISTQNKKQLAVYLHPLVYEQLRTLAFEERHKMHDYLIEGLNLVFQNRGLKSIQDLINKND